SNTISSTALIDTGTSGFAFIDSEFASRNNFPLIPPRIPRHLDVIDGCPIASGLVTHTTKLDLVIDGHHEKAFFFVTKLGQYPLVLGLPWMRRHDVVIHFGENKLEFKSPFCRAMC
ncbi:unnamed protein product, partial [Tuber aestivum]